MKETVDKFVDFVAISSWIPGDGPFLFLFWMLVVIAVGIWWGMREDKK